jgi:AraC family transcriptional regulator, exoenzyme S synthesis regulatory protein ExsA
MSTPTLPETHDTENFSLMLYSSDGSITRGRNVLRQNMVSMVIAGEKQVFFDDKPIYIQPSSILLLAAGNYLHTERRPDSGRFTSIIIFFDSPFLAGLLKEYSMATNNIAPVSHALIPKDGYLYGYIDLLHTLLTSGNAPSKQLQAVKIKELLLYLLATHPGAMAGLLAAQPQKTDAQKIQQVVTQNLMNGFSISEIAFLCNMSLPTFKRKFTALYHTSPAKWMQQRRLEAAAQLLYAKNVRPADVYLAVGYDNHSSFSKAFKGYYGLAPKDYNGEAPLLHSELLATI